MDDDPNSDDDLLFLLILIPCVFMFATFIPIISLMVRRLHDIGYSGAFIFLSMIPFARIYLLYLLCLDSQESANEYGPSPKYIMPITITNNYIPPMNVIAVTPVVQPVNVIVPVQQAPIVEYPNAPYPQDNIISPPVAAYPQQNPMNVPPVAPYPQQNPAPSNVSPYPAPADPYSKPNPIQPNNDPYYNSSDFTGY